jgi:hypothetical protein
MATNLKYLEATQLTMPVPTGTDSGDPLVLKGIPVVAMEDEGNTTTGYATCRLVGVFDLSVKAVDDTGNTLVAFGDNIYFNSADDPVLSRKQSGQLFGKALEAITTVGGTSTINVMIGTFEEDTEVEGVGTYCEFKTNPATSKLAGGAASATGGDVNIMLVDGMNFEYSPLGTQTITAPVITANGLEVGMDQTANDGVQITRGITARSPEAFVVGTSPAFYAKMRVKLADVSGTDDCAFGFRKAEAYQAAIDNYDEMAAFNIIAGVVNTETIINNNATVTTNTTLTWADNATKELEVRVSSAGVVTYRVDGVVPPTVAAFTFDTGEVVIPFFYYLHDTDICETIEIAKWESGLV